jgi:hypothetical protein
MSAEVGLERHLRVQLLGVLTMGTNLTSGLAADIGRGRDPKLRVYSGSEKPSELRTHGSLPRG